MGLPNSGYGSSDSRRNPLSPTLLPPRTPKANHIWADGGTATAPGEAADPPVGGPGADAAAQIAEAIAHELESLSPECRADPDRLRALLSPDFHEFGASGREVIYEGTPERVAAATRAGDPPIGVEHLRGQWLADGLVMLKYTSVTPDRRAHRTALWRRVAPGRWQLFHHQGTVAAPE